MRFWRRGNRGRAEDDSVEEQLRHELSEVGRGAAGPAGGSGARLGARLTSTRAYETECLLNEPMEQARRRCHDALSTAGVVNREDDQTPSTYQLTGAVDSGFLNMNPAIVTMTLTTDGTGESRVHLHAEAQEGLINQHTARKAVERLVTQLSG